MPLPFDETESGFTPTALNLVPVANDSRAIFDTWGNPERQKLNECAPAVNLYNNQRWGIW